MASVVYSIGVFFQFVFENISKRFFTFPRYTKRVTFIETRFDRDVFIDLDNWYNKYHLIDYTNRHVYKKMQLWCIVDRMNEIKNNDTIHADKIEYDIICDIYEKINNHSPELISEIHAEFCSE
jgi:hypothetical protein